MVFDKNPAAMENLVQAGARRAASTRDVADSAEIVMTCLPASPDVEDLYLSPGGLVACARPGTILIDLSSVLPSTPRQLEPAAKKRGVHFLESPVSGGVSGARAATLAVMVGVTPTCSSARSRCCVPSVRTSSTWDRAAPATPRRRSTT